MAYVVTAGELIEILKRFPPGSELLLAKDPTTFIPITNVTGGGFLVNRSTEPPTYVKRKSSDEQTSELCAVLWPADAPILEIVADGRALDPSGNAEDDEDTPIPGDEP